jgi:cephalosporin-C deacetylase-like acetyl esterase
MGRTIRILLLMSLLCSFDSNQRYKTEKVVFLGKDGSQLLNEFLLNIANNQFENRHKKVSEALKSAEGVRNYIETIKRDYLGLLNIKEWNKTPLNAKTTGEIKCEDYRIEKVLFESRPNHHITGNLYIPANKKGPFPAVLEPCGHSTNGKAYESYQSVGIIFAKNGFVALVIDTYGQGERLQLSDSALDTFNLASTNTHALLDIGSMLVGSDIVSYQIWDNIRAIDYLCSRPEVDKEKIGVTGNSGGGTQTMFLMGLDSRIKAAAPCCGIQTRARMFTLNGPADGCHHLAGEGLKMLEYSDYFILSAPKPILILAAEKDNLLDINAVSYSFREAKWFYKESGVLDRLDLFTYNGEHNIPKVLREADVWWFKRWLQNDNSLVVEPKLVLQKDVDLNVTKTGQVLKEFKEEESIVDINIQMANNFSSPRKDFWKNNSKQDCISKVKELIHYQDDLVENAVKVIYMGNIIKDNILIQKLLITSRDGFPLPVLMYVPKNNTNTKPVTVYLDEKGKNCFGDDAFVTNLVNSGRIVLTVDLRGFGETTDNPGRLRQDLRKWNSDHRIAETSLFIGRPLIGQRVQDAIDVLNYLFSNPLIKISDVELIGVGSCGPVALHVAAIDTRVSSVKTIHSISSWMDIIREPLAKNQLINVVPGAMRYYDLSDLKNSILPRHVEIIEPADAFGRLIK